MKTLLGIKILALVLAASPASANTVTLKAEKHNMFRVDVRLNNTVNARALIDTGASAGINICQSTASALRLRLGDEIRVSTANGIIPARRVTIDSVRVGEKIELRNVTALVSADTTSCDVLVGMALLRRLHMTLNDNTLTLTVVDKFDHQPKWMLWTFLSVVWVGGIVSLLWLPRKLSGRLYLTSSRVRRFRSRRFFMG